MKKSTRRWAIAILLFNVLSAIYGGGSLIYDPSGKFLQLPIELQELLGFKLRGQNVA